MAYHLELDGCMSHGETPEEALQNLFEVTQVYLSILTEMGIEPAESQDMQLTWYVLADPVVTQETVDVSLSMQLPSLISVAE